MRDPNHLSVYFRRLLSINIGSESYNWTIGETMQVAVAWAVINKNDGGAVAVKDIRAERSVTDKPVWKDFLIERIQGLPVNIDVVAVNSSGKTESAHGRGVQQFDINPGMTLSAISYCMSDANTISNV